MKRRTFISLAGMTAASWFPMIAKAASQDNSADSTVICSADSHTEGAEWENTLEKIVIRIIGIGNAGGNAVDAMIRNGIEGVEFVTADTDTLALERRLSGHRIQLGESGLGAGADPEAGRLAAIEARAHIVESLRGTHMLFIVAGLGGGTGSGAAPVVAEVARELGIFTVAMVISPFSFEGGRVEIAKAGVAELRALVNSVAIISNDKLVETLGADVLMDDAFKAADDLLHSTIASLSEIIEPGLVAVDFEDVRAAMGTHTLAQVGFACSSGPDRARQAANQAIASSFLEKSDLERAVGVVVHIKASSSMRLDEVRDVMDVVRANTNEMAHLIFGATFDDAMGNRIGITIVAARQG